MRFGFTPRSVAEESRSADEFFGDTEQDRRGCRCLARLQHQQWHLLPKRTSVVADSEGPTQEMSLEQKRKGSLLSSPPLPHQLSCWGNNLQHLDVSCFSPVGLWRCVRLPALANRHRHNFWVSSVGPTAGAETFDVRRAGHLTQRHQLQPSFLELFFSGLLQNRSLRSPIAVRFINMPRRTGWHNLAAFGKRFPERGLLLLMVWLLLEGSVLPLGAASSPDVTQQADMDNHTLSEKGHNEAKKPFPVLSLDYENVRTPFEIALWVLLASLMKLGEYWSHDFGRLVSAVLPGNSSYMSNSNPPGVSG